MRTSAEYFLSDLSLISPYGLGLDSLAKSIKENSQPHFASYEVQTPRGIQKLKTMSCLDPELPEEIPSAIKRRMPRITALVTAVAFDVMAKARSRISNLDPSRVGLVVGTAHGCLEQANLYHKRIILEGPLGASPALFAGSVQNSLATTLSIALQMQGPTATVSTMDETVMNAIHLATTWLDAEVASQVFVVVGDEISDYHRYAFACNPTLPVLAEGFVGFWLTKTNLGGQSVRLTNLNLNSDLKSNLKSKLFGHMETALGFEIALSFLKLANGQESSSVLTQELRSKPYTQSMTLRP